MMFINHRTPHQLFRVRSSSSIMVTFMLGCPHGVQDCNGCVYQREGLFMCGPAIGRLMLAKYSPLPGLIPRSNLWWNAMSRLYSYVPMPLNVKVYFVKVDVHLKRKTG